MPWILRRLSRSMHSILSFQIMFCCITLMVIVKLIPQSYVLLTDLQIFSTKNFNILQEADFIYIPSVFRLDDARTYNGSIVLDPLSCFIFIPFLSLPDNTDEMNKFELTSAYRPTGDQPEAIAQLTEGVLEGVPAQTLLGVTGSGKTFTIANVIANINKPTLILSHNKTLAAQLYSEFKGFFPNNAVEYYVSYYDYYQPEAYLPSSDTYIEKDLAINDEIDKLRLAATSALLSGRKDVVVVSSVSCIYGMGNPADFYNNVIEVQQGKPTAATYSCAVL